MKRVKRSYLAVPNEVWVLKLCNELKRSYLVVLIGIQLLALASWFKIVVLVIFTVDPKKDMSAFAAVVGLMACHTMNIFSLLNEF